MQRLRWHGCLAAPYAPCSCCAGATPATRRAAAARHICSASARSWPHRVSMSRCGRRAIRGSARREVVDGVRINRAGGAYSIYIWAGLAMVAARIRSRPAATGAPGRGDRHPERPARSWRGWPTAAASSCSCTTATASCGRSPAGWKGRFGWFVESRLSPWLHRRNQYVTVSLPSARDLTDLGVDAAHIAVVRNGLDEAPAETLDAAARRTPARRGAAAAGAAQADRGRARRRRRAAAADARPAPRHRRWRLVARPPRRPRAALGISDAVTFHGHVDDVTKHEVLQR